uniref:Uncharacterized protein n=1 Tax=Anopheles dirus TaxID=7168 RepID=A0A182NG04_9DIPT
MESNYVSVFRLDGVPILPPMINDEVRAAVAVYRQKALDVEKRLEERRRTLVKDCIVSQSIGIKCSDVLVASDHSLLYDNNVSQCSSDNGEEQHTVSGAPITPSKPVNEDLITSPQKITMDAQEAGWNATASKTLPDPGLPNYPVESSTRTVTPTLEKSLPCFADSADVAHQLKIDADGTETAWNAIPNKSPAAPKLPNRKSATRTVTPTSEESLQWFPLVRSNTYNLEKPSLDLMVLHRVDHSTPVDRAKEDSANKKQVRTAQSKIASDQTDTNPVSKLKVTPKKTNDTDQHAVERNNSARKLVKSPKDQTKPDSAKCYPKARQNTSRKIITSRSSTGSGFESDQTFDSIAQALTAHEQRMKELLKRQEEERILLEQSFRQKTQELVALCAKSLTVADSEAADNGSELMWSTCPTNRMKTPDVNPASSVSQLSLCDMSYDSCTDDTDDAAYQTCHANGTSEENGTNNENTLVEEEPTMPYNGNNAPEAIDSNTALSVAQRCSDAENGNDQFDTLSARVSELQRYRAATIINAHVRGYLTRRLYQTEEVERIKRTIADIVCFIISWQTEGKNVNDDPTQTSIRRNASKHIDFCLHRLHEIFILYTTDQRLEMIRRDRCVKRLPTLPNA